MLVSPPFLPPRDASATDEEWLAVAMPEASSGRFPVSLHAAWHGGVHLLAPVDAAGDALPVVAIADGEVVFVRSPVAKSTDRNHPQNYGSASGPVWTDNGCVVLRHITEIGMGAGNAAVSVTFFSVYMHLSALATAIQTTVATPPQKVFRKELLGTAGQVYDQRSVLHFEIGCDDDNVAKIVGRAIDPPGLPASDTSGSDLSFTKDGRSNALFGTRYFFVPLGAKTFSRSPVEFRLALDEAQAEARRLRRPIPTTLPDPPTETGTLAQPILVHIEYALGDAIVTSTELDATPIKSPITFAGREYELLEDANALAKFVELSNTDAATPTADVPPASACLELLQFGRILGPDALTPATTPNWWQVELPGGTQGFVNLNEAGVFKYSDADFPQWQGWRFGDGTTDLDQVCEEPFVLGLLDADGNGVSEQETDPTRFSPGLVKKLSRLVVNFPTEWQGGEAIDLGWGFLKTKSPSNPNPLNDADFATFLAHAQALCFWDAAVIGLPSVHWHFHPAQFLLQMRKSFWLAGSELTQCIPRKAAAGVTPFGTASARGNRHATPLSDMFRRYGIASLDRMIHMLSQIILESAFLRTLTEDGRGNTETYAAFYGRGYIQITHPETFITYGKYRKLPDHTGAYTDARITATSTHPKSDGTTLIVWSPRFDPDQLETNLFTGADASGHFWLNKHYSGTSNLNREADLGLAGNIVGSISRLVNGGGNGYDARQEFVGFLQNVLGDEPLKSGTETRRFPRLQAALKTFPPGSPANDRSVVVNHTPRQRS